MNLKVHCRIHRSPPTVHNRARPIQSKHPSYYFKLNFNIILPSKPRSSKWSRSLRFPHQSPVCISPLLPHTRYMPSPSQSSLFDHTNNIWWKVKIIKFLNLQSSPFPLSVTVQKERSSTEHSASCRNSYKYIFKEHIWQLSSSIIYSFTLLLCRGYTKQSSSFTQSSCAHKQHFTQSHSLHTLTDSTSLSPTVLKHSPTALPSVTQS